MHARSIAWPGVLTLALALTLTACGGAAPTGAALASTTPTLASMALAWTSRVAARRCARASRPAMAAYGTVVAAEDIPPFTHGGRCEAGRATEGGYVPGDGHPGASPDERVACWIDGAGIAHSITTSLPFVLLRVDGRLGASTAEVGLFPMLGSRDQPGGPTLWAQEPMSPEK